MSDTRFNSKLDDLAPSITVTTKQQMSDFGTLDAAHHYTAAIVLPPSLPNAL